MVFLSCLFRKEVVIVRIRRFFVGLWWRLTVGSKESLHCTAFVGICCSVLVKAVMGGVDQVQAETGQAVRLHPSLCRPALSRHVHNTTVTPRLGPLEGVGVILRNTQTLPL